MKIITIPIVTVENLKLHKKIKYVVTAFAVFSLILFSHRAISGVCGTYSCSENERLELRLEKADKSLNNEYKSLSKNLTALQKSSLIAAQREWIRFRDDECEKFADDACKECDFSNSAQIQKQANDALMCKASVTEIRTKEFEKFRALIMSGSKPDFSFSRDALKFVH